MTKETSALIVNTRFGSYTVSSIVTERYIADDSPAILLWSIFDGPIARITVCLDDKELLTNEAYVDTNNCPWAPDWITANGFGKATGKTRQSGYCTYPSFLFDMDRLAEYSPKEGGE